MAKYRVAQVGVGSRGTVHLDAFLALPDRFEPVGLCDLDAGKLEQRIEEKGLDVPAYADAATMLEETRPDVFCFVTHPDLRLEMVELAVRFGVKGLAFEKPMATSLFEAKRIRDLCVENGIKAVVSHQQKYLTSLQKVKEVVDSGDLGEIHFIRAATQAWISQLGTHFMDYALWAAGGRRVRSVVGHIHGKDKLSDSHPSCDYLLAEAALEDGPRIYIECGYYSPSFQRTPFWVDNRLSIYGDNGYVWGETDGRWGMLTPQTGGKPFVQQDGNWRAQQDTILQPLYMADLADWLDDDENVHPCNVEISYHGYEVLEAACLSALEMRRVDLPLEVSEGDDLNERMRRELPDCPAWE